MKGYGAVAAVAGALSLLTVLSAEACPAFFEPRPADAYRADIVLEGHVSNFKMEQSVALRAAIEKRLDDNPDTSRKERRDMRSATDRARITIEVDHTIKGSSPSTLTVYWLRTTNSGPPANMSGSYLFALRRNPSAGAESYTVMQRSCSSGLVFQRGSVEANSVRAMFGLQPEAPQSPRKPNAPYFGDASVPWTLLLWCGIPAAGLALIGLVAIWRRRR